MIDLPLVPGQESDGDINPDDMIYIAYGEQSEEVAFELTEDLEEALEIMEQMQDDGFKVRLFQAQEIDVIRDDSDDDDGDDEEGEGDGSAVSADEAETDEIEE